MLVRKCNVVRCRGDTLASQAPLKQSPCCTTACTHAEGVSLHIRLTLDFQTRRGWFCSVSQFFSLQHQRPLVMGPSLLHSRAFGVLDGVIVWGSGFLCDGGLQARTRLNTSRAYRPTSVFLKTWTMKRSGLLTSQRRLIGRAGTTASLPSCFRQSALLSLYECIFTDHTEC